MSTLKRRLSGTRTFAATYNNTAANADATEPAAQHEGNHQSHQQQHYSKYQSQKNDNANIASTNQQAAAAAAAALLTSNTLGGPLPFPLHSLASAGRKPPVIQRYVPCTDLSKALSNPTRDASEQAHQTQIAQLSQRLHDLRPIIKPRDTLTTRLDIPTLRLVAAFVGDSYKALAPFASMNRAARSASTHCVEAVVVVPCETSLAKISAHGGLDSFAQFLKRGDRGHHAKRFAIVEPRSVYDLDASLLGPSLCAADILRTIKTMPNLLHVDVRGVALRDHLGWADHFLDDVARLCPLLQSLRIGLTFAKGWKRGWWLPVQNSLKELVVGSRREDSEFISSSSSSAMTVTPNNQFQLPCIDDLLVLMKVAPLATLKIWPALAFPQLSQLLFPINTSGQYTNLQQLSLTVGVTNANLLFTPEGDAALNREREILLSVAANNIFSNNTNISNNNAAGQQLLRAGASVMQPQGNSSSLAINNNNTAPQQSTRAPTGKAGQNNNNSIAMGDADRNQQIMYPSLISLTLADVNSKPDLITELIQRMSLVAPDVRNWNITNTHKQGPTALANATAASQQRTRRPHAPAVSQ